MLTCNCCKRRHFVFCIIKTCFILLWQHNLLNQQIICDLKLVQYCTGVGKDEHEEMKWTDYNLTSSESSHDTLAKEERFVKFISSEAIEFCWVRYLNSKGKATAASKTPRSNQVKTEWAKMTDKTMHRV